MLRKDSNAGEDWGQEEKGETGDETVGCIINSMDMSLSKFHEMVKDGEDWRAAARGVTQGRTQLGDWTAATKSTN